MSFNIFINTDTELLKDKRYNPILIAFAHYFSTMDEKEKIVDAKLYKIHLLETLDMTYYKINQGYECLFDNGIFEWISKKDKLFKINSTTSNFVKVTNTTAEKFIDNKQFYAFKIYCYLLKCDGIYRKNKSGANKYRGDYYQFSYLEIVKAMGYSKAYEQIEKVKKCLQWMQDEGLINYDDKAHTAPGFKGSYHPLYSVNQL